MMLCWFYRTMIFDSTQPSNGNPQLCVQVVCTFFLRHGIWSLSACTTCYCSSRSPSPWFPWLFAAPSGPCYWGRFKSSTIVVFYQISGALTRLDTVGYRHRRTASVGIVCRPIHHGPLAGTRNRGQQSGNQGGALPFQEQADMDQHTSTQPHPQPKTQTANFQTNPAAPPPPPHCPS